MKVTYRDSREQEYYQDVKAMRKDFGELISKSIIKRHNELLAIDSVGWLLDKRVGKAHLLRGNWNHCVGLHLTSNWRLVIRPEYSVDTDFANVDFYMLDTVRIEGVIDYHGK